MEGHELCIWCARGYPPAEPSLEHVVPDSFGGRVVLPEGAVCRDCNQHLNREVDLPLKRFFQPMLTALRITSGKGRRPASSDVYYETSKGVVKARLRPSGTTEFPMERIESEEVPGGPMKETYVIGLEQLEALRERLGGRCKHVDFVGFEEPIVETISSRFGGRFEIVLRGVAKIALNVLALRLPNEIGRPRLDDVKSFVTKGDGSGLTPRWWALKEQFGPEANIDFRTLRPVHLVGLRAAPGRPFVTEVGFFGSILVWLILSERWDGGSIEQDEQFQARQLPREDDS